MNTRLLKTTWCFILLGFGVSLASAQSSYSPSASTYTSEDYSIQWSLGELKVSTLPINDSIQVTQGFNQPFFLICDSCNENIGTIPLTAKELSNQSKNITIYPNPVINTLNIEAKLPYTEGSYLAIIDALGQVLRLESIPETTDFTTRSISVEKYLTGRYYIKIFNGSFSELKGFIKS